ncbi:hypothetical protein L596_006578 [Steinernema carpocapsae]|uniref:Uncharacterized protein n=1 Tax=Steinernema carpocapsae TaxID=34508 RepID=A0A4U8V555_STECR|nr:hypothetical protein L596_006578 [Steinernema carpocapsae]
MSKESAQRTSRQCKDERKRAASFPSSQSKSKNAPSWIASSLSVMCIPNRSSRSPSTTTSPATMPTTEQESRERECATAMPVG